LVGIKEANAVQSIHDAGLEVGQIHRLPNDLQPKTYVYDQNPNEGDRVGKGSFVELWVSTGKAQVTVPDLVGENQNDAVAKLTAMNLRFDVHDISSSKPQGTVIAQNPTAGTKVAEKTTVRINVSSGPKPVGIPDVRGSSYETAASQLQAIGFAVARQDTESDQAAGTVIDQTPAPDNFAPKGSTVTLTVSKGPKTTGVPNVENEDEQTARSQLEASGFKVRVEHEDTTD